MLGSHHRINKEGNRAWWHGFVTGLIICHLLGSAIFAWNVKDKFPGASLRGAICLGLIWPAWLTSADKIGPYIPAWFFDFERDVRG